MMVPELDTPLLQISDSDVWTVADAVEGTQIFGSTGSGKTSSSGALLADTFLRHGFGGLVLCAKTNERARWEDYARKTGREQSLVIFSPHMDERHRCQWRFNFLDYEFRRSGSGAGLVENIVELINATKRIFEGNQSAFDTESHWARASNELIRNAVHLLSLGQGSLSLDALYQLVIDAPEGDQAEDAVWQKQSFCWHTIAEAERKARTPRELHNFRMAKRYWLQTYAGLADRTRSSVYSTFSAIADVLLHDAMWELFCTDTNLVPEVTYDDAALIVLDMPIREYGKVGVMAQRLFKYMWQRAMLRRDVTQNSRPVMLFCDEAQNFIDNGDFMFQAESREARAATVYITQNISNYYAVLGEKSRNEVNALLGHFQTKLFHANSDSATNQWASETVGHLHSYRRSWSMGHGEAGSSYFNIGGAEQREYKVEPAEFALLHKGGQAHNWQAEALMFQGGRQWRANKDAWLKAAFPQIHAPQQSLAIQEVPLTRDQQMTLLLYLLDLLLIFRNHGSVMDIFEAMQWQQNAVGTARQPQPKTATLVACVEGDYPVPIPDIAATVQSVLVSPPV